MRHFKELADFSSGEIIDWVGCPAVLSGWSPSGSRMRRRRDNALIRFGARCSGHLPPRVLRHVEGPARTWPFGSRPLV
jgi:hypothetical protein